MGTPVVLGLDIGGANLKAATPDGRAVSVPFALWKHPEKLPDALAELVARFPDATDLAVTMTGELCDCFETKRQGVNAILDATEHAAAGRPVRVWGTDGAFHTVEEARAKHLTVAAANWHALATFAGRYVPTGRSQLIDIGSTTTDIIPLRDGKPIAVGLTDYDRLKNRELLYFGVRRTPLSSLNLHHPVMAEHFATTQDIFLVLGHLREDPSDCDTADNRPATRAFALARLARMMGADTEMLDEKQILMFALHVDSLMENDVRWHVRDVGSRRDGQGVPELDTVVLSGAGEFLARRAVTKYLGTHCRSLRVVSLNEELGPQVSACAPAYAVAVLAAEARA